MHAIDSTFDMLHGEMQGLRADITGLRTEVREEITGLRTETSDQFAALRADLAALHRLLAQVGFGLVGVVAAAMVGLIVTLA